MEIREDIEKIGQNKKPEDMQVLGDMLAELICMTKDAHPEVFEKYSMEIYEMAYGKVLTKEIAEEWVKNMNPPAKWDYATTSAVKKQYNITDIDDVSFYTVMNMLYSDMSDTLGSGDDAESVATYVQATKDWLHDEDASKDKLYRYWRYIAKAHK